METGIEAFTEERQKQIDKHGFTGEHHAEHPEWYDNGQLVSAAHMLSQYDENDGLARNYREIVPLNWDADWWKRMIDKPFKDRLRIAGALLAAEWDRQKALGNFD